PSVDTWIGPETPTSQNWSPGTPITPSYSGIGGSGQGGFLHGGLFRMFWYGNGSYGEYRWSGAQWLCRAFDDWFPPFAVPTPCYGVQAFSAYEASRQVPDGTSRPHGNNGAVGGLNLAAPLPWLSQFGIGTQFGFSTAAYNWGNDTPQQTFVTTGIFRR